MEKPLDPYTYNTLRKEFWIGQVWHARGMTVVSLIVSAYFLFFSDFPSVAGLMLALGVIQAILWRWCDKQVRDFEDRLKALEE